MTLADYLWMLGFVVVWPFARGWVRSLQEPQSTESRLNYVASEVGTLTVTMVVIGIIVMRPLHRRVEALEARLEQAGIPELVIDMEEAD